MYLFIFYIYDDVVIISPISSCVVSYLFMCCFFSLFIHMFLLIYAIFYFCFTLRCLMSFCLKCFKKTGFQNLLCHELSSCKIFQEFMLRLDLLYSTSDYEFSDLWLLSYFICLLWFYHGLPKEEIIRTYVELVRTYVIVNWLIFWQNALYL